MSKRFNTTSNVSEASLFATVTRKDGTIEDLGEIAYYHKNPLKRIAWKVKKWLQS